MKFADWPKDLARIEEVKELGPAVQEARRRWPDAAPSRDLLNFLADEGLADIFISHGLKEDGEPNDIGLLAEWAINTVNRYRFALDSGAD